MTNTINLMRVLRASPEVVYRAFVEAEAIVKWIPPHGYTAKVHHMNVKEGGTFKMSFTDFAKQTSSVFSGKYLELKPFERICYTDKFEDPNLEGEMTVNILLKKVTCGVELNIVQESIPDAIPLELCYVGWQESLILLGQLVEKPSQAAT